MDSNDGYTNRDVEFNSIQERMLQTAAHTHVHTRTHTHVCVHTHSYIHPSIHAHTHTLCLHPLPEQNMKFIILR